MSKLVKAFAAGVGVGYYLGSRPREQAVAEIRSAAQAVYGFTRDRVADAREAKDTWQSPSSDSDADPFPSTSPGNVTASPTWADADIDGKVHQHA
ncbi:MAG: hypothetical protein QM572_00400 [Nocardioides sp.]|uniref:hypothetical protein n=1 Tax=Nocardioides sp. TaxID=35761 RepID=UPI0039E3552F